MKKDPLKSTGAMVGAAVRQLRKERGWTLEVLSAKTDISVSGLSQLENGRTTRVRRENLTRLAKALAVSEEELDPRHFAARVASQVQTLEQRRLIGALLALPAEDAAEAARILADLAQRRARRK